MRMLIAKMLALPLAVMLLVACGNSDDGVSSEPVPDGVNLLGLQANHTLNYMVIDSIVTILPDSITIVHDTSFIDVGITRGSNNQVTISLEGVAHDLLTIDNSGILHSGQIRPAHIPPDTVFFYPTPTIMPRVTAAGTKLDFFTPPYSENNSERRFNFLIFNYGYRTERRYIGPENIVLPGGSYATSHFQSLIFYEGSTDTLMTVDEYYAFNIGPIKVESRFGFSRRLMLLLDSF